MRAARLHRYGEPFVIDEVPRPDPLDDQVVVKVEGAGFCHSDLHVVEGEIELDLMLPLTLGHENAGVVAEVGSEVRSVKPGDPVAVYGAWGCGYCDMCVSGTEQMCSKPNWAGLSDYDGGYAEYLLVPHERYLVRLENLEPKVAAPFTDAALTPYRAIKRALDVLTADRTALVIGAGGLGQFGIKLLRALTPAKVIAVDVNEEKLQIAREYGADVVLDGRDPEAADRIRALSGGGAGVAFDFVGADATLDLAFSSTRPGGNVTQIGLAGGAARLELLANLPFEVSFEGTLWGSIKELREVIALAESGRITPIELEFEPLDRINEAYQNLKAGKVPGRIVITP